MDRRALGLVALAGSLALGLAGCGVSVAAGGENAATHPATGVFVSPTVGAGNVSGHPVPPSPLQVPSSTPPKPLPPGLVKTVSSIEAALAGGCWENSHAGNVYGAWDQLFWWQGQCAATVGDQVTVELYPSAAAAAKEAHHPSPALRYLYGAVPDALVARYLDGAVLVDVFQSASPAVISDLSALKGLRPVPGYGG